MTKVSFICMPHHDRQQRFHDLIPDASPLSGEDYELAVSLFCPVGHELYAPQLISGRPCLVSSGTSKGKGPRGHRTRLQKSSKSQ